MNREDRAHQFQPFEALRGLREELRRRELIATRVPRRRLSQESGEKLSRTLVQIRPGDRVLMEFYDQGHYLLLEATVTGKDSLTRTLTVGQEKIRYEDIYRLKRLTET